MLTLDILERLPKTLLQAADGPSQADVYEINWNNQALIVKDYSKRPAMYQKSVCRWQFRREWLALLKLRHVPNVPRPVCRIGEKVLVMTKLQVEKQQLNGSNARSLERKVALMHQAGVTHNDLHSRNLMLDQARAYLYDFGTALFRPLNSRGLKRLVQDGMFELGCFVDRMAVVKYEMKHNPRVIRTQDQKLANIVASTRWMSRIWYRIKRRDRQPLFFSL